MNHKTELTKFQVSWMEANPDSVLDFSRRQVVVNGKRELEALEKKLRSMRGNARQIKVEFVNVKTN